jgi:transposase-like protein
MSQRRYTPEQIIHKLREAEVEISKGGTVGQACKKIGVTEQTFYRWRAEYGGLKLDQAKRLKALETENARLKRMVADQALDIAIFKEAASGNF